MSRRKRKSGHDEGGGGGGHGGASGRWLVSYSDFITLMFVVFVVMYSFAKVDNAKFGALAESLRSAMGPKGPDIVPFASSAMPGQALPIVKPGRQGTVPPDWPAKYIDPEVALQKTAPIRTKPPEVVPPKEEPSTPTPSPEPVPEPTPPPKQTPPPDPLAPVSKAFANLPGARDGILTSVLNERGLELSIAGSILFEPGQYRLKPDAADLLNSIAANLQGILPPILVEGAADEKPVSAPGAFSPWDLAALRAGAVIQYLSARPGMGGAEFVAISYRSADGSQTTPNRKVTIVVQRSR